MTTGTHGRSHGSARGGREAPVRTAELIDRERKLREEAERVAAGERELSAAREELHQHERGFRETFGALLLQQVAELDATRSSSAIWPQASAGGRLASPPARTPSRRRAKSSNELRGSFSTPQVRAASSSGGARRASARSRRSSESWTPPGNSSTRVLETLDAAETALIRRTDAFAQREIESTRRAEAASWRGVRARDGARRAGARAAEGASRCRGATRPFASRVRRAGARRERAEQEIARTTADVAAREAAGEAQRADAAARRGALHRRHSLDEERRLATEETQRVVPRRSWSTRATQWLPPARRPEANAAAASGQLDRLRERLQTIVVRERNAARGAAAELESRSAKLDAAATEQRLGTRRTNAATRRSKRSRRICAS